MPYKILCFNETYFKERVDFSFPDSYNVHRCDRAVADINAKTRRASGVALLIHKSLKCKPIELDTDPLCEFLVVEVILKPKPLIVYVCYMSIFELSIANKHYERIRALKDKFRNHLLMVVGDFNLKKIVWQEDELNGCFLPTLSATSQTGYYADANDFLMRMISLPMFQVSNVKNSVGNVLDLVFVSNNSDVRLSVDPHTIIEADQQDVYHVPYDITIEYYENDSTTNASKNYPVFCFRRGNYECMCQQLNSINFAHEINIRSIDDAHKFFQSKLNELTVQTFHK